MNMCDGDAALMELPSDEKRAMAFDRVFLSTHQSNGVPSHPFINPGDAISKGWLLCQKVVLNLAAPVTSGIVATRPKFFAEERIGHIG